MKRLIIILLSVVAHAQAVTGLDAVLFENEHTIESSTPAGARDCKKCSKPRCGGCTRR